MLYDLNIYGTIKRKDYGGKIESMTKQPTNEYTSFCWFANKIDSMFEDYSDLNKIISDYYDLSKILKEKELKRREEKDWCVARNWLEHLELHPYRYNLNCCIYDVLEYRELTSQEFWLTLDEIKEVLALLESKA